MGKHKPTITMKRLRSQRYTQPTLHDVLARPCAKPKVTPPETYVESGHEAIPAPPTVCSQETSEEAIEILVANTRGLSTHREEIKAILQEQGPVGVILTETKMTSQSLNSMLIGKPIRELTLAGYQTYFSNVPSAGITRPKGKAGVAVSIKSTYIGTEAFNRQPTPTELHGYVCHTTLLQPGRPRSHIIGVYMPEDMARRNTIYQSCNE
jgi:hypothetical protein